MQTLSRPLLSLTAADLMSTALVVVPQSMSLQGAARLLSRANVSGAPVVDSDGRCVGVLSASDFVAWADKGERAAKQRTTSCDCAYSAWQIMDAEDLPQDQVEHHMTADPVTAAPVTVIDQLARMMVDAHIHRIIVVDAELRPVGIVSSTDILAAVAHAHRRPGDTP